MVTVVMYVRMRSIRIGPSHKVGEVKKSVNRREISRRLVMATSHVPRTARGTHANTHAKANPRTRRSAGSEAPVQ